MHTLNDSIVESYKSQSMWISQLFLSLTSSSDRYLNEEAKTFISVFFEVILSNLVKVFFFEYLKDPSVHLLLSSLETSGNPLKESYPQYLLIGTLWNLAALISSHPVEPDPQPNSYIDTGLIYEFLK